MISRIEYDKNLGFLLYYRFNNKESLLGIIEKSDSKYMFTPMDGNNRYNTFKYKTWKNAFKSADNYEPWSREILLKEEA